MDSPENTTNISESENSQENTTNDKHTICTQDTEIKTTYEFGFSFKSDFICLSETLITTHFEG